MVWNNTFMLLFFQASASPPWLVVGTTLGLALVDVATREVRSAVDFSDANAGACFAPSLAVAPGPRDPVAGRTAFLGCAARFVSPGEGPPGRERAAVFSVRLVDQRGGGRHGNEVV